MLSDYLNCAGTRTKSALFPFDYAFCPDSTAFAIGFSPLVRLKLRSKLFLRSFLPPGALGRPPRHECRGFPLCSALAH
jgi:hypothetical protein